jgi:hypothetical protein
MKAANPLSIYSTLAHSLDKLCGKIVAQVEP